RTGTFTARIAAAPGSPGKETPGRTHREIGGRRRPRGRAIWAVLPATGEAAQPPRIWIGMPRPGSADRSAPRASTAAATAAAGTGAAEDGAAGAAGVAESESLPDHEVDPAIAAVAEARAQERRPDRGLRPRVDRPGVPEGVPGDGIAGVVDVSG